MGYGEECRERLKKTGKKGNNILSRSSLPWGCLISLLIGRLWWKQECTATEKEWQTHVWGLTIQKHAKNGLRWEGSRIYRLKSDNIAHWDFHCPAQKSLHRKTKEFLRRWNERDRSTGSVLRSWPILKEIIWPTINCSKSYVFSTVRITKMYQAVQ